MADALTPAPAPVPAPPLRRARRFRGRFRFGYAVLGLLLSGALAAFIVLLLHPGQGKSTAWSSWRPTTSGNAGSKQIADFVSHRYRRPDGSQLVGVFAGPPQVQNIQIAAIAIRSGLGNSPNDISILPANDSVMYILCGLGANCSIDQGTPSLERARLLRREALELALYTMHYMGNVDSVLAFMPPPPGTAPTSTLFFRRDDLRHQLKQPLAKTLPTPVRRKRLVPGQLDRRESLMVDQLTSSRLFRYSFQQTQAGNAIIVLQPPAL